VQSYTWIATAGCVLAAGAVPVFADIDPLTYTLDPADVERRITPRTRAIIVVHLWGHPGDMDAICDIARRRNLLVIEDASHAHGGTYKGRKVGTIGDMGCFSFQATKAIPAGEGGMLVTNSREFFERALLLAQSPGRLALHLRQPHHVRFRDTGFGGFKYRINPLNAVIGYHQLQRFEGYNRVRQANLDYLTEQLTGIAGIRPPFTAPRVTRGGFYGYAVQYVPSELDGLPMDTFITALQAEGVPLARERYPLLHLTPMFREQNPAGGGWPWSYSDATRAVRYAPGDLPVSEDIYPRLLALPAHDRAVPCQDLHAQYAEAFRKVVSQTQRLKSHALAERA